MKQRANCACEERSQQHKGMTGGSRDVFSAEQPACVRGTGWSSNGHLSASHFFREPSEGIAARTGKEQRIVSKD